MRSLIVTVAAMMAITTAQAAETKIYVHPNGVTIWEAPESFKHVFVGSVTDEDKDLITASASGGLGDRRLVLTVRCRRNGLQYHIA